MPRLRRRAKSRRIDPSRFTPSGTLQWRIDFGEKGDPFGTSKEFAAADVRELWEFHRDALLDLWIGKHPGTRPRAWWRYDAPGAPLDAPDDQLAFLERHGLLRVGERERAREGRQ